MFEDRFGTAAALRKMGADITCKKEKMPGSGVYPLKGARVKALDLRGGAALAVAAPGGRRKNCDRRLQPYCQGIRRHLPGYKCPGRKDKLDGE